MDLIERNDLVSDFLTELRPCVLDDFQFLADAFPVNVLSLALHETSCKVSWLAFECGTDSMLHFIPLRPLGNSLVDIHCSKILADEIFQTCCGDKCSDGNLESV